jgi:hypothetical protein
VRRVAAALVTIVAALAVAGPSAAATASVRAWTEPARPFFGDRFAYLVEVVVEEERADAVRIDAGTGPFTALGEARTTRTTADGAARIRVTQALGCLSAACAPRAGPRAVALPPVRVTGAQGIAPSVRAVVRVRPRVAAAAVRAERPAFRSPTTLEATTTNAPAWALTTVSLGVALLAVLAPALLALSRRRRRGARRGPVDQVARAIRLLRESVVRLPPDRRRAASLAARVVTEPGLAEDAARVAWSRPLPDEIVPTELAERIERARGRPS